MINVKNESYKIILIDTCIVSEMLKRKGNLSKNIFSKILDHRYPCFSFDTIIELKRAPKVYEEFIDVFSFLPAFILKNSVLLIEEEILNYGNPKVIDPVITILHRNPKKAENFDVKAFLNSHLTKEYLEKNQEEYKMALESMLDLRNGYPPKNGNYTLKEIEEFVELVTYKQLVVRDKSWCQDMLNKKKTIYAEKFPSIQIMCYLAFYKFYINNRKPKLSDVTDLLIATSYPYIDEVITEKNQSEMVRQIQKKHKFCNNLTTYTIKDFI